MLGSVFHSQREIIYDYGSTTIQEQEQEAIETVLDETKRTIKKTINEAKREIPRYIKAMGELQEETIQATKEIGYDCIELQREAASLVHKIHVLLCALGLSKASYGIL